MTVKQYQHVKVPGFGCTYPQEYEDKSSAADFALSRLVRNQVLELTTASPTFLFIIEAGMARLRLPAQKNPVSLDFENIQFLPENTRFSLESATPTVKVITIAFKPKTIAQCCDEYALRPATLERFLRRPAQLPRTTWLNEVCHRYAFERSIAQAPHSLSSKFLELEILKEFYFANRMDKKGAHDIPYFVELPGPLKNALQFIERNLHKNLTLDELARVAVTSKPTLVRLFRKHLHTSPIKYFWSRRVEEADRLLLTGRFNVSEVAEIVGFSDPSAFSDAYKSHFGAIPSARKPQ